MPFGLGEPERYGLHFVDTRVTRPGSVESASAESQARRSVPGVLARGPLRAAELGSLHLHGAGSRGMPASLRASRRRSDARLPSTSSVSGTSSSRWYRTRESAGTSSPVSGTSGTGGGSGRWISKRSRTRPDPRAANGNRAPANSGEFACFQAPPASASRIGSSQGITSRGYRFRGGQRAEPSCRYRSGKAGPDHVVLRGRCVVDGVADRESRCRLSIDGVDRIYSRAHPGFGPKQAIVHWQGFLGGAPPGRIPPFLPSRAAGMGEFLRSPSKPPRRVSGRRRRRVAPDGTMTLILEKLK